MKILSGHPVVQHLFTALETPVAQLRAQGIVPCLALIRVGADPAAQSYARTIQNRFAKAQVAVQIVDFPTDVQPTIVVQAIKQLNQDTAVHGIMCFTASAVTVSGGTIGRSDRTSQRC